MQTLNERHYRATRARIHIFQTVLDGLVTYPDDDLPEPLRRDRVDAVRIQLHDLESELVSSITGVPGVSPVPARYGTAASSGA